MTNGKSYFLHHAMLIFNQVYMAVSSVLRLYILLQCLFFSSYMKSKEIFNFYLYENIWIIASGHALLILMSLICTGMAGHINSAIKYELFNRWLLKCRCKITNTIVQLLNILMGFSYSCKTCSNTPVNFFPISVAIEKL